eukprot:RCo052950
MLVTCSVAVAVLIYSAGYSSADSLATTLMSNVVDKLSSKISGQSSFQGLNLISGCLKLGCVQDFEHVKPLLLREFTVAYPSYLMVYSLQNQSSVFPLGNYGEFVISSSSAVVLNRSTCAANASISDTSCSVMTSYTVDFSTYTLTASTVGGDSSSNSSSSSSGVPSSSGPPGSGSNGTSSGNSTAMGIATGNSTSVIVGGTNNSSSSDENLAARRQLVEGIVAVKKLFGYGLLYPPGSANPQMILGFGTVMYDADGDRLAVLTMVYLTSTISTSMAREYSVLGDEGKWALVSTNGSLLVASVNTTLFPLGTYTSLYDKWFGIWEFTSVPMISEGGRKLMMVYNYDLTSMTTSQTYGYYYGGTRGLLTARKLDLGLGSSVYQSPMYCLVFVAYDDVYGSLIRGLLQAGLAGMGIVVGVAILCFVLEYLFFVRRFKALTVVLTRLRTLNFAGDERPVARSMVTEIHDMEVTAFALEEALLAFAKFLPRTVVRMLLRNNKMHQLGMRPAEVGIHFSDIVNFTG